MSTGDKRKTQRNNKPQDPQIITRKEFLKEMGSVVGGVAIASLAFTSACGSPGNTTTSGTTTTTNTTTSLPPAKGFVYITPSEPPPVMQIPGCTTSTATDRKYTIEHMWIKMVAENIVAIGISEKFATLVDFVTSVSLPEEGRTLEKEGFFGYIESLKMNVELIAPVSGKVLQVNNEIYVDLVYRVNGDPYGKGWFVTMQLSNPEEWARLITPQEYTDLNAKVV